MMAVLVESLTLPALLNMVSSFSYCIQVTVNSIGLDKQNILAW